MHANSFAILQQALKARNMTYADLAKRLDLSEPTIKRIFSQRDCKLSRLLEICDVLEVNLSDVVDRAERSVDAPLTLPIEVEAALAKDKSLFHYYILLRDKVSAEHILGRYNLSQDQLFALGMKLERLNLVEMRENGQVRLMWPGPIQFRKDGPLMAYIRELNLRFLNMVMTSLGEEHQFFTTVSRRMRPDSGAEIQRELAAVHAKIAELARQDQLLFADSELMTFKFTAAWGAIKYDEVLQIEAPCPGKQKVGHPKKGHPIELL
ncbi:helix-turn-helix transcriptional regulator [Tropicibacter sp. R15_0]|uniref:helix-turn-helix domain-containing protein n=1 Tax=Tropicibacter sp. R15_0 TaxID=2821101 RepID=UPI001ADB01FA|nr:helix-turn-helix transcriptional regulator [Tropicibacter sp. R15_0]MBO9464262.1 helix-turn-helix transcriptional regulator [Tropicibacter sp. R15_0]